MGIIMINCPATGRDVSTGIEVCDVEELPIVKARMFCPACGGVHDWTKREARLADYGERTTAAADGLQAKGAASAAPFIERR